LTRGPRPSMPMKIATVVGARPQFVKASMISRALRAIGVQEFLIHTGQHYDENMSDVFFHHLDVAPPSINLAIGSGTHGQQTGRMLEQIESVLLAERPVLLITYGDTNSTLAGALAAVKLQIPLAHVEAGLRSYDKRMPEEVNRVMTDHASDLLFAPTQTAVDNLLAEGITEKKIHVSGDVMYDAALYYGARAETESQILGDLDLRRGEFVLVTMHRAENTDNDKRLESIFSGLLQLAREVPIVMPLHPRTKSSLLKKKNSERGFESDSRYRSGRIFRHDDAREKCAPDCHGFRRRPKRGLLLSSPVRNFARPDRMARTRGARLE